MNSNVSFSCEIDVQPLQQKRESIGIDVGLQSFAIFLDRMHQKSSPLGEGVVSYYHKFFYLG